MLRSISSLTTKMFLLIAGLGLVLASCKKDEPTLGEPPSDADARFTFTPTAQNPNIIEFKAANPSLDAKWDFGNGATAEGSTVLAVYPFAGVYTVSLTVVNSGGSNSSSQDITINDDDPGLVNNPLFDLLTGGLNGPGFKTWAVDSARAVHFGVGPNPVGAAGNYPEWYSASANEKKRAGMYDDRYTFYLQGFKFDHVTNGDVYVNSAHAGIAPFDDTTASNVGDYVAQLPDQLGKTWIIAEGADTTLSISPNAMIGYWAGTRDYQIIKIDSNELFLRYVDALNPGLAWYIRLVPEGFSNPDPPAPKWSLPLDFETVEPTFTTFGGSSDSIISNPDASGINTSGKVLETIHGNEPWAGLYVDLDNKLDFSVNNFIKLKVWAPDTGTFRLKLEDQADPNSFVEMDAKVTTQNAWEELTWDMSSAPANFDRVVMFPGWNVPNAGTFYLDDIKQE